VGFDPLWWNFWGAVGFDPLWWNFWGIRFDVFFSQCLQNFQPPSTFNTSARLGAPGCLAMAASMPAAWRLLGRALATSRTQQARQVNW
jgi:hypothetical protein